MSFFLILFKECEIKFTVYLGAFSWLVRVSELENEGPPARF
ncbi:hypothetical protein LEP1GSC187_2303 [Leptospira santarosai str. ZUN179]|uniref:Uncharacterized protein n=1 Tax=Leptospira santarosai str. ZUN179 TaxID=1049985 RepID=M6V062_9LEPT|nr:hypothetical protein LEP1GSC187_2303 [Leptospira santarosai str. ZUN179]EMO85965.1 hypothetical protein LEP1GSC070_1175 [Leptospira santarosai str. AIM]